MKQPSKVKTIGILGGGQLGMFLSISAKKLKKSVFVYSEIKECSAKNFCDKLFVGQFDNLKKIKNFVKSVDVVTVETENIPIQTLKLIESYGKLRPSFKAISISQNRLLEKNFINSLGIKTTKYRHINSFDELKKTLKLFDNEIILKSCTLGYDGKNQFKINKANINAFKDYCLEDYIAEKIVNFRKEISVISSIDTFKNFNSFPPVENSHKNSILTKTKFPSTIPRKTFDNAIEYSELISKKLDIIGIITVEMFVLKNNEILVNEIAPRPHNSGHWTIDCCKFSQFDNVIISISGKKLERNKIFYDGEMHNIIGEEYKKKESLKKKFIFYDYYKKKIKPMRKMGHYTILGKSRS